jgi:hypothetical protein
MKVNPRIQFLRDTFTVILATVFFGLIWLYIQNLYVPYKWENVSLFILLVVVCVSGFVLNYLYGEYVEHLTKLSRTKAKGEYLQWTKSPLMYVVLFVLGLGCFWIGVGGVNGTNRSPPHWLLIVIGFLLLVSSLYSWVNKNRAIKKIQKVKLEKKKFDAEKKATIVGLVLCFAVGMIYDWSNMSWKTGFFLALCALLIALLYYKYLIRK